MEDARADKQYGVVRHCLRDIGQELHKVFVERHEPAQVWNGDPATLTDEQLDNLLGYFVKAAAKQKEIAQRAVVDAEFSPAATESTPSEEKK